MSRKQKNDQARLDVTNKHRRFLYAAIVVTAWLVVFAPPGQAESGEIQVLIENDSFAGTDRYYSSGVKVGLGAQANAWPKPVQGWLESVYGYLGKDKQYEQGFFVGQNIYTPRDIKNPDPQPNDRPWAGWLYAGWALQWHTPAEPRPVLDTLELNIGVIGPPALAEEVQTQSHKLVGVPEPRGWDHQLPTEPGFVLGYLRKIKIGNESVDIIPHAGVTMGTVMTLARAGGIVRWGKNLSGFGPDAIEPGGAILQGTHAKNPRRPRLEYYLFTGLDVRAVAYNAFLDGNLFRSSPSVDREPIVYDLRVGLSVRYNTVRVSLTQIRRSEEFSANGIGSGSQTFHSLNLGLEF